MYWLLINYMGIFKFFGWLQNNKSVQKSTTNIKPNIDVLCIDNNSNLHMILSNVFTELNEILYMLYFKDLISTNETSITIDVYYENMELPLDLLEDRIDYYNTYYHIGLTYDDIKSNLTESKILEILHRENLLHLESVISCLDSGNLKQIYVALDGVPSLAKIYEQANRRYMSAYISKLDKEIVCKYKFDSHNVFQLDTTLYRSYINPGTEFMLQIQQSVFNIECSATLEVSSVHIKGEGEKKIIDWLNSQTDIKSNYCIISPDTDMFVLLALLARNPLYTQSNFYHTIITDIRTNQFTFIDVKSACVNLQHHYSTTKSIDVNLTDIYDIMFMILIFGNDFLPKLDPFNLRNDFDKFVDVVLETISTCGNLTTKSDIDYQWLKYFFDKLNIVSFDIACTNYISNEYYNYDHVCRWLSIDKSIVSTNPKLGPIKVSGHNFFTMRKKFTDVANKVLAHLKQNIICVTDILKLYTDINSSLAGSYFLTTMPRVLKFPGCVHSKQPYDFFVDMVLWSNKNRTDSKIIICLGSPYNKKQENNGNYTTFLGKRQALYRAGDTYKNIFGIRQVNLLTSNGDRFVDIRDKYYKTYIRSNITSSQINDVVLSYVAGIKWLFDYYINNNTYDNYGWYYKWRHGPLIRDIVQVLSSDNINQTISKHLFSRYVSIDITPYQHWAMVTPNDFTGLNISPNCADIEMHIDGTNAMYANKCQVIWDDVKA